MEAPALATPPEARLAWFCLRSHPKHEHIAAKHLRQMEIETLNPRIRFPRSTRQGPVWVTEALFPNYLFARFNLKTSLARVHYAPGVSGVVHFGDRWPAVPDQVIAEIRAALGADELHVISHELSPGDNVQVAGGLFHGLKAVITQVMPARQRVVVLMDLLGRQTAVELAVQSVIKPAKPF
jgi:transcriptional antiterminator RfaH